MSDSDGPPLLRPIPRRPFDLNLTSATPPDDSSPATPAPPEHVNPDFLNPTPEPSASALPRPQSYMNLTTSTLFGIFSDASNTTRGRFSDPLESDTPWGTGAQTPIRRPSIDEDTYQLLRDRAHLVRHRTSFRPVEPAPPSSASSNVILSLVWKGILLFLLGMGYGSLVTARFPSRPGAKGVVRERGYSEAHLLFWGVAGVVLGSLLPWFDRIWGSAFGEDEGAEEAVVKKDGVSSADEDPNTDWALVMRAIGAFVGIVFAIRKVAWASTLQLSLTLALANPLLWWLIDRSKPGLVLSTAVGLTGSAFLLGVNPEMMPVPAASPFRSNISSTRPSPSDDGLDLGALAHPEMLEKGVWMLSVLFCSCLCFGNIGRRLTSGKTAAAKGRWAGVR